MINYPISPPASPLPASIVLHTNSVVMINRSPFTNQAQVQRWGGDSWGMEVTYPPLSSTDLRQFTAFLLSLNGMEGTFLMGPDPLTSAPRGVASGNPTLITGQKASRTIVTQGWTLNTTNILRAGDYIQIGPRLHQVLLDANSNGSGQATLEIFPRLRFNAVGGETIITVNPRGIWRLASNETAWSVDTNQMYEFQFAAVEAL